MTTPNQPAPDGAVTIGGSTWNYGQLVNEKEHLAAYDIEPPSNIVEAVAILPTLLGHLPNTSMRPFQKWLNLTDEDRANGTVKERLIESLQDNPLRKTIDGLVRGLVGWSETGYSPNELEAIARDLAATVTDMRAVITGLQSANGFAGVARIFDFSGKPAGYSLGSEWTQSYYGTGTGSLGIEEGVARWLGDADNRWGSARYNDIQTKSDYQKVGCAFATKPSKGLLGASRSVNRIMARVSEDMSSYVAVDFEADRFTLGCSVGWSWTTWEVRESTVGNRWEFKPGAAYWLECGTTGGARVYRVWENSTVLMTFVESGAASLMGASNRWVGLAVKTFSGTMVPGKIASFAFYDNQPDELKGSGWRVACTFTATNNLDSGDNTFPSNWFDTPDYITDDLTYNITTNGVTVAATGWYQITLNQYGDNAVVGGYSVHPTLYVDGVVAARGQTTRWAGYNEGFAATWIVYLYEGAHVKPGYWASATIVNSLVGGDAGGTNTFWSGVYLGVNKKQPTEV